MESVRIKVTKGDGLFSLQYRTAPSMTCAFKKSGEIGGRQRCHYKLPRTINCPISCVTTRCSGGWKISSDRCNCSISHSGNAEHREEEQQWSSVCKPHGPWHGSYNAETERLQDSRGKSIIIFPDAQLQLDQTYFCDNLSCCSPTVFNALG